MITRRYATRLIGGTLATSIASTAFSPLSAQARAGVSIGTAGKGGFFYPLGTGIAAAISKNAPGLEATAIVTGGAAENMKLLHEKKVDLALAQADVAWSAAQGKLNGLPEKVAVRTLLGTVSAYMRI